MPTALVTVGSTLFPDLIAAFDPSGAVFQALEEGHFDKLLIQYGNGTPPPTPSATGKLQVDAFPFSDGIDRLIGESELVISHAGSGSILTALRAGRKLIVVPNTSLMDNHQAELALALEKGNYLYVSTPETLAITIKSVTSTSPTTAAAPLQRFPPFQPERFRNLVDTHMGYIS
ncbi:hypothetical protein QFC20_001217 [Naganishia adeliensis]|uniref:Uncharacterized protein n=1 Tax=Naganishia adeliensis TaxID=92952 RepID=A0ACC2WTU6_9TREE|nr:hypothetical protein QFC20_001217 [Naganishia adeliensis]